MNFSRKNIELYVLLLTILVVALWQLLFILRFPDADTDAYAHFIIARDIVRNSSNLSLHWVWLPLFHYIGAFFVLIGSEMQSIRYLNIVTWNVIPVILYLNLKKKETDNIIPIAAALLTALSPIGILMGTTAQPEPLFALLILLFIITIENRKYLTSSVILSLACMLRYEAWAVLFAIGIYILIKIIKEKSFKITSSLKIYTVVAIPLFTILFWAVLRQQSDGQWFSFLRATQQFANDALGQSSSIQGGLLNFLSDVFFYPFWIPFLFTGIAVFFIPFGFRKFYSKNGIMFVVGISILAFISFSWVMKANLGLSRHFTSIVPFYSVMTAFGLYYSCEYLKKYSIFNSRRIIPVITTILVLIYTTVWLNEWSNNNQNSFKDRKSAATFLNELYNSESAKGIIIINNDPVLEVLSKINYKTFDHFFMRQNQETTDYILTLKNTPHPKYIISTSRLEPFLLKFGTVIFQTGPDTKDPNRIIIIKL